MNRNPNRAHSHVDKLTDLLTKHNSDLNNLVTLACSLFLTILASIQLPVKFTSTDKVEADITIIATGIKSPQSLGSEVWVSEIPPSAITASTNPPGWERRDNVLVSYQNQPAILHWTGKISREYALQFVRHDHSGQLIIGVNGKNILYDLYSDKGTIPLQIRPFELMTNPRPSYDGWGVVRGIVSMVGLFLIIHFTLIYMLRRSSILVNSAKPSVQLVLLLAVPSLIIYSIVLLAMWPGQMSSDSVAHWAEIATGKYADINPAAPTLIMGLLTRIWHSPAIIPTIQIIALTAVTVLILLEFRKMGAPRWLYIFGACAFPLYPANFLMVTTIWRDVPYSMALAVSFLLIIKLTSTQGHVANATWWRVCFCAALVLALFSRHNGLLFSVATPLLCVLSYRDIARNFFVACSISMIGLFLLVKVVIYPLIPVEPIQNHFKAANALHVLGAYYKNGTPFSIEEEKLLTTIYPLERWKVLYECQQFVSLLFGDEVGHPSYPVLGQNMRKLNSLAFDKILKNPSVYLKHQACVTSILWRIFPEEGHWTHATPLGIVDFPLSRQYGLVSKPKLPGVNTFIKQLVSWTKNNERIWMYWRPGLWLLLSIISVVGISLSKRDLRFLLLLTPSVLNTISMAPVIGVQDYRYQYSAQLIGMFIILLAFMRNTTSVDTPIHSRSTPA